MIKNENTNNAFMIVWFGQLMSSIGSGLTAFALGYYAFKTTGTAAHYALVLLAAFLPGLLLKPLGGVIADRMDRRVLMVIGDAGAALGVVFIIVMMLLGIKLMWPIYMGCTISSIFIALHNPAYKASISDMLSKKQYAKASGMVQLAESARHIIAPVIAGLLLSFMQVQKVLLLDCLTFIVAIITVMWVKKNSAENAAEKSETHFWHDFMQGLYYLRERRALMTLLVLTSVVTFFIGVLQSLLGPMILSFESVKVFGVFQTIATTGLLISSIVIGMFGKSQNKIKKLILGLISVGVFFALMGVFMNIILITLFAFLLFMSLPFVNTSLDVLVRSNVDKSVQGRVWGMVSLVSQLGMVLAFAISGFIADHLFNPWLLKQGLLASSVGHLVGVGPGRGIGFVFVLSGLCLVFVALIISRVKRLRELDSVC